MLNGKLTIATLGSHSALQILKGARDEGFKTLVVTTTEKAHFYKRFKFIDEILSIPEYSDFENIEKKLRNKNCILVPHGSFVAHLGLEINKRMSLPYFGNKSVLDFEAHREKQRQWLKNADINVPAQFEDVENISYPVIVKSYGAAGGKGYFYAKSKNDFKKKIGNFKAKHYVIQEYVIGVTLYIHYFYSPLSGELEILSMDRRYETNVDSLGRIPLRGQVGLKIEPSYVVVGNSPLILRESLLHEAYDMGERIIKASRELIDKRGLWGPFCLETVITEDSEFFAMEISCRIVAGTNLFIEGSPYSWLTYNEPMSTGRRIAREIKIAKKKNQLSQVLN